MDLINSFAVKIQRQWRAYLFRKRFKQLLRRTSLERRVEENQPAFELKFDNSKIKRLVRFEEEDISSGTTLYDKGKYASISTIREIKSTDRNQSEQAAKTKCKKALGLSKSSVSTPRQKSNRTPREESSIADQLSRSLERPLSCVDSKEASREQEDRRASFNTFEERRYAENRRHSTGELPLLRATEKQLQIGKAYELRIDASEQVVRGKGEGGARTVASKMQTEANIAFRKGSSIDKMVHKCRK
jgi:myosin heavy subunit